MNQVDRLICNLPSDIVSSPQITRVRQRLEAPIDIHSIDAVVVMGASMDFDNRTKRWYFPTVVNNGIGKVDAGNSRTIAARQLVDEGFDGPFWVTGGREVSQDGRVELQAIELARLMIGKRGINQQQVVAIGQEASTNTHGNVADVVAYLTAHPEIPHRRIGVLANEWHILRALLIFYENPYFKNGDVELVPIIANTILRRRSARYQKWDDCMQQIPEMQERERFELSGIEDLARGRYKPRH